MKKCMFFVLPVLAAVSCRGVEKDAVISRSVETELVSLQELARLLSSVELGEDRCREVHDAVSASRSNGYDEEYTMADLFECPGSGVGDKMVKGSVSKSYERPLKDVFVEYFSSRTKASDAVSAQEYINYIKSAAMQIYWPGSEDWDGHEIPTITFDPLAEQDENVGYVMDASGSVKEVTVNEEYASEHPVWVINYNDDASYVSLDVLRRNHPEWDQGGNIVIGDDGTKARSVQRQASSDVKTLVLKDFTMHRQYDNWFRGASEFHFKLGKVESFKAANIEDIYRYDPSITDFIIVVKRKELDVVKSLNTVVVSEWTSQFQNAALMLIEDDGGTRTTWKCSAVVKYNSKSFGYEIEIPFNSRDDIVWRGSLTRKYIESNSDVTSRFGDVSMTFSIINN